MDAGQISPRLIDAIGVGGTHFQLVYNISFVYILAFRPRIQHLLFTGTLTPTVSVGDHRWNCTPTHVLRVPGTGFGAKPRPGTTRLRVRARAKRGHHTALSSIGSLQPIVSRFVFSNLLQLSRDLDRRIVVRENISYASARAAYLPVTIGLSRRLLCFCALSPVSPSTVLWALFPSTVPDSVNKHVFLEI